MMLHSTTTMEKLEKLDRTRLFVYILSVAVLLICGAAVLFTQDGFDRTVTVALNRFNHRSFLFDAVCHGISENTTSSGLIFVALLWYCWFSASDLHSRYKTLAGTIAAAVASLLSRATQLMFPSRARPFQDPSLHLTLPFTVKPDSLRHVASSFPSDHAALYFALAATIYSVNRKAGYYAIALAVLLSVIRMYLGFHYFTDTLGGAALGILVVCVIQNLKAGSLAKRVSAMCQAPSPAFYAVAFCVTYTIATMFSDVRVIASQVAHVMRH
jgi:membrane-associated phospholipid phosphatase